MQVACNAFRVFRSILCQCGPYALYAGRLNSYTRDYNPPILKHWGLIDIWVNVPPEKHFDVLHIRVCV